MKNSPDLVVVMKFRTIDEVGVEGVCGRPQRFGRHIVGSCQRIHLCGKARQRVVNEEMRALALHLSHEAVIAEQRFLEEHKELAITNSGIVLGAGNGEFPCGDPPVQKMPGPGLFLRSYALAEVVRIVASHQRRRADAFSTVVQPQSRLAGMAERP